MSANYYNVAEWKGQDAHEDLGQAINEIIADIKKRQNQKDHDNGEGMPGATIYIPSGDWHLKTTAVIDISFLHIEGAGHGFTSSSIRFNVPKSEWGNLTELWPGGSRVMVEVKPKAGDEASGAAFLVKRGGSPRISSVDEGSGSPRLNRRAFASMAFTSWTTAREWKTRRTHTPMAR